MVRLQIVDCRFDLQRADEVSVSGGEEEEEEEVSTAVRRCYKLYALRDTHHIPYYRVLHPHFQACKQHSVCLS